VDVAVNQARDDEFSSRVKRARVRRHHNRARRSDRGDLRALDDDRTVGCRWGAGAVNQRRSGDDQQTCGSAGLTADDRGQRGASQHGGC
jgi:hypothetical protein